MASSFFGSKEGELLVKNQSGDHRSQKEPRRALYISLMQGGNHLRWLGKKSPEVTGSGYLLISCSLPTLSQGRAVRIPWHNYPALGFHSLKTVSHDSGDFFERRLQKQEEVSSLAREPTRQAK